MMITKPGRYNLPADVYHGNCCDAPSLSNSGAVVLTEECPAAFWHAYLRPDAERENKREFDMGTAGHLAMLEPDEWDARVAIVDADDFKTKAAREARDEAYAAGKTPLLPKHRDAVKAMSAALFSHPLAGKAFTGGKAEQSYFWRDAETGVWLKCRPDYVADSGVYMADFKTTTNAHPRAFERTAFNLGYYRQAAWYLDGVATVTGAEPRDFWFVVQEIAPPHLVAVYRFDERAIEWGRLQNRHAINLFAECVRANRWPGYGERAMTIKLPSWAEFQLEERREGGEFERRKPDRKMLARAVEAQAPV